MKKLFSIVALFLPIVLIIGLTGCLGIGEEEKNGKDKKFISDGTDVNVSDSGEGRTNYDLLSYSNGVGYDTSNEKVFELTVLGNKMYPNGPGGFDFVEIIGQNSSNVFEVTLAPSQYLDSINLALYPNDEVTVTACALPVKGGEIMVARLLEKGGKTYWLRDDWGVPLWTDEVVEEIRYVTPTYTSTPAPRKEEISEWEGDLLKKKWHERGEMMKHKWAERNQ